MKEQTVPPVRRDRSVLAKVYGVRLNADDTDKLRTLCAVCAESPSQVFRRLVRLAQPTHREPLVLATPPSAEAPGA